MVGKGEYERGRKNRKRRRYESPVCLSAVYRRQDIFFENLENV